MADSMKTCNDYLLENCIQSNVRARHLTESSKPDCKKQVKQFNVDLMLRYVLSCPWSAQIAFRHALPQKAAAKPLSDAGWSILQAAQHFLHFTAANARRLKAPQLFRHVVAIFAAPGCRIGLSALQQLLECIAASDIIGVTAGGLLAVRTAHGNGQGRECNSTFCDSSLASRDTPHMQCGRNPGEPKWCSVYMSSAPPKIIDTMPGRWT